jgi:hypothetical protein
MDRVTVNGEYSMYVNDESFVSVLVLEGSAEIGGVEANAGDSLFVEADFGELLVKGEAKLLISTL